jgi:hypothetical protein
VSEVCQRPDSASLKRFPAPSLRLRPATARRTEDTHWSLLNVLGNAVAHYFKFHSLDEIRAEVARQDLCLRFDEDLSPLFRPVPLAS